MLKDGQYNSDWEATHATYKSPVDMMNKFICVLLILFAFSGIVGCNSETAQNQVDYTPTIPMQVLAIIGEEGQPIENQLGEPVAVRTDKQGNIYIADKASLTVKVYDPDGNYFRSFGGRGRGPGEFQYINLMERTPEGNFLFLDRGKLEFIYLTKDGEFISSHPVDLSSQMAQYYPKVVSWIGDNTLGLYRNTANPWHDPSPFQRPFFHIYTGDFQQNIDSFFPFDELNYETSNMFVWCTFAWLPGSVSISTDKSKMIYSPGVYTGKLYEFSLRGEGKGELEKIIKGTPTHTIPFEIYESGEEYEMKKNLPGANRIFYEGGPYVGRIYSVDTGVYYLSNGKIAHFYGEWRQGDKTMEEGNLLDIQVQIFDREGTLENHSYITSLEWDSRPSVQLVNWKDEEDNFYLLNLSKHDVPTVIKFRLDLGES